MDKITLHFTEGWGLVLGWVSVPGQNPSGMRFLFKIDTGASWTLLLDEDFDAVCKSLGWDPIRDPDTINWIRLNPQFFKEEKDEAYCIAGTTQPIFRIRGSYMYLLDSVGNVPRSWKSQSLLRGTYSAQYSKPTKDYNKKEGRASHISLLGIDKLNELEELLWRYPVDQIALTR